MRRLAIVLLFVALPALAQTQVLLSAGGSHDATTGIDTLSEGWELTRPFRNVTISVWMNNGGGAGGGTAYLMRSIGPGTTRADEEAMVTFDLPLGFNDRYTLFEGLDLPAGVYWLVFAKPKSGPFSYANWATSRPEDMVVSPYVRYLGMAWVTAPNVADDYMPASAFNVFTPFFPYQIEVTGLPAWIERRR